MRALVSLEAEAPDGAVTEAEFADWLLYAVQSKGEISVGVCERLEAVGIHDLYDALARPAYVRTGAASYPGGEQRPPARTSEEEWPERILLAERILEAARPFVARLANADAATGERARATLRTIDLFLHKLEKQREVTVRARPLLHLGRLMITTVEQPDDADLLASATAYDPRQRPHAGFVIMLPWTASTGLFLGWRTTAPPPAPASPEGVA